MSVQPSDRLILVASCRIFLCRWWLPSLPFGIAGVDSLLSYDFALGSTCWNEATRKRSAPRYNDSSLLLWCRLELGQTNLTSYVARIRGAGHTELSHDIVSQAEFYEWLFDDVAKLQLGLPTITFRAKVNLDPVVDFLHQTMLRVLGRLTHGILMSGTGQYVGDDWLAWSLDYDDPDMFNVNRVYDDSQPDFHALLDRFPQLRANSR